MFTNTIAASVLSALCMTASATQSFSNKGTRSGFNTYSVEHSGSVQEVTNVFLEGPTALKMTQIYDPSYGGRYHAEAVVNDGYKRGQTRFYGFSFRLQADWDFQDQVYNIAQFIAPFNNACDDWSPTTIIAIKGNQLLTRRKHGNIENTKNPPGCDQKTIYYYNRATVSAGEWHKVVLQVNWQSDASGYIKMWFDGQKVLEEFNVATTLNADNTFSYRVGLYANGWYDDKGMKGNQGTRQIWYDEIAVGTTFADVDPAQWKRKSRVMRGIESE